MDVKQTALATVLKRNRLQHRHIAQGVGVSRISVGHWVHGRSVPSGTNLVRLVEYLRQFEPAITAEDLVGAVGDAQAAVGA